MSELAERSLHTRIARSVDAIRRSFVDNLFYITGCTIEGATTQDHYTALAFTVRDRLLARMVASNEFYERRAPKMVAYLSAEFLPRRAIACSAGKILRYARSPVAPKNTSASDRACSAIDAECSRTEDGQMQTPRRLCDRSSIGRGKEGA
jgi:hypothetical protein